ncbi:MAG TPA: hypothetical protein VHY37_10320, partial [Tepidisphaeraceae bacterium]|nr:hypothetical protein [Tepidisphaeraceae bacterium]
MTRLDRHIRHARNKLMLDRFVERVAWTLLIAGAAVWAVIVVERLCDVELRGGQWWLAGTIGAAVAAAMVMAGLRRPTPLDAAVAIDDRLALKEKFSTALYARGSSDPFARAAVADAEKAADSAVLANRFPIGYPRRANAVIAIAIAAMLTAWLLPNFDVLGIQANRQKKTAQAAMQRNTAIANAKQALMQLDAAPAGVADADAVRLARQDLERLLQRPPADATPIQKHVESALQKLQDAQHHLLANSTLTENDLESVEASLDPPPDDKGPVADAHRALAHGKIDQAMDSLTQAVDNLSKMPAQQQQQAVQQMSTLAHQL